MLRKINFTDLWEWMGSDYETAIPFLMCERLLHSTIRCSYCDNVLQPRDFSALYPKFLCRQQGHFFKVSIRKNTWFENATIPPYQVMWICLSFVYKMSYQQAIGLCSWGETALSVRTVIEWFNYCREICVLAMAERYADVDNLDKIGGTDHVVQIDICRLGRRKHESELVASGNWVIGIIDVTTNKTRFEICPNGQRNADTLFELIDKHVDSNSAIHTNCWGGYNGLMGVGFAEHLAANYAQPSVEQPANGQTNGMQSQWKTLRYRLSRGGVRREKLADHMAEYMWHMDCRTRRVDPFQQLMDDIRSQYSVV